MLANSSMDHVDLRLEFDSKAALFEQDCRLNAAVQFSSSHLESPACEINLFFNEGKEGWDSHFSLEMIVFLQNPDKVEKGRQYDCPKQTCKDTYNKLMPDSSEPHENEYSLARRIVKIAEKQPARAQPLQLDRTLSPLECLGVRIGALRRQSGISIEELSKRSGVDPDTLFGLEVGRVPLGEVISLLGKLSVALQVDEKDLTENLVQHLLNAI